MIACLAGVHIMMHRHLIPGELRPRRQDDIPDVWRDESVAGSGIPIQQDVFVFRIQSKERLQQVVRVNANPAFFRKIPNHDGDSHRSIPRRRAKGAGLVRNGAKAIKDA